MLSSNMSVYRYACAIQPEGSDVMLTGGRDTMKKVRWIDNTHPYEVHIKVFSILIDFSTLINFSSYQLLEKFYFKQISMDKIHSNVI